MGYGLTLKLLLKNWVGVVPFFDDKADEPYIDKNSNKIYPSNLFNPNKSQLEVTTPSFKPTHPLIKKANNLISEYDFFAKEMPFSIWISGTQLGKTTTNTDVRSPFKK